MADRRVEYRKYPRSRMTVRVEVRLTCGVIVDGRSLDLSLSGLLLETERTLPLDCPVRVTLVHDGESCEHLECRGTVCRLDPRGVAVAFDEMSAGSLARLHHLLQLDDAEEEPVLAASFAGEYY